MHTFLSPIEKPQGLMMKLAYYFIRRQFGKSALSTNIVTDDVNRLQLRPGTGEATSNRSEDREAGSVDHGVLVAK
jgi:hypothetical protein